MKWNDLTHLSRHPNEYAWCGMFEKDSVLFLWKKTSAFINTLRPKQNGRHFADDIVMFISMNENFWILNKISLTYVPYGAIDNMAALTNLTNAGAPSGLSLLAGCYNRLSGVLYVFGTENVIYFNPYFIYLHCGILTYQFYNPNDFVESNAPPPPPKKKKKRR